MSEESKKAILKHMTNNSGQAVEIAFEIATKYAKSANADPEKIPALIENLAHLFETGEVNSQSITKDRNMS
ncbi:hypothetical protein [Maridesulfovibrio ferrireducens]|uniref:hypothetical protein n=1 Tax=Maridesulfovibrio ferrireducens TaxID=246191 RepID=UPI001A2BAA57|nr:hypothetical protein [Maridesulfovibrio ferrireducens]MBI9113292.1 hypothetical protein [Maridesulfovibrio ferrireducens]